MRPPNKSRSRNKNRRNNNNNNGGGNVLNRVYDSAGPDGRVRGTPVQVIEKYQGLAHDNALSGDRVAMENFQQHAEHYIRLINEAQKQIAERREQLDAQNNANGNTNSSGQQNNQNNNQNNNRNQQNQQPQQRDLAEVSQPSVEAPAKMMPPLDQVQPSLDVEQPATIDPVSADSSDGNLVDTPEGKGATDAPKPKRARKPRAPKKVDDSAGDAQPAE